MMKWKDMALWQKKKIIFGFSFFIIIASLFIGYVVCTMVNEKKNSEAIWEQIIQGDRDAKESAKQYEDDAIAVSVGTYVENIKEVSLKSNYFRVVFVAWYRWNDGDDLDFIENTRIYNARINKQEILKDYHQNGVNYQQVRLDVTCNRNFTTKRFPLESHNLRFYIEPTYTADQVIFTADTQNSSVNPNLNLSGYHLSRQAIGSSMIHYPNSQNDPRLEQGSYHSEIVTCLQINRSSWGAYLKCFTALIGTSAWVMIAVFVCAYHRVNPLGTIAAALFGTVGNIMIGTNLLPDVMEWGLLEFVNLFGLFIMLAGILCIIQMNRLRDVHETKLRLEHKPHKKFTKTYGQIMFFTLLIVCILGNIIIPVSAYIWS